MISMPPPAPLARVKPGNALIQGAIVDGFPQQSFDVAIPTQLNWPAMWAPKIGIKFGPDGQVHAVCQLSIEALLDLHHPGWRGWPTVWVDGTLSAAGDGSAATPYNSLALVTKNTTTPSLVMIKGSSQGVVMTRDKNFTGSGTYFQKTDLIFKVYGGRVISSTHELLSWMPGCPPVAVTASVVANSATGYIDVSKSGSILTLTAATGFVSPGFSITIGTITAWVLYQITGTPGGAGTYQLSASAATSQGTAAAPISVAVGGSSLAVTAAAQGGPAAGMVATIAGQLVTVLPGSLVAGSITYYPLSAALTAASATVYLIYTGPTAAYYAKRSSVNCVLDLMAPSPDGCLGQLRPVFSLATCLTTAGTWYTDGVFVVVNRPDGLAPTNNNTHALLTTENLTLNGTTQYTCVLTGATPNDWFELRGGSAGCWRVNYSGNVGNRTVVAAAQGCVFRYGGGSGAVGAVAIQNHAGIVRLSRCDAAWFATDLYNFHDPAGYGTTVVMDNCTGRWAGQLPALVSNNGETSHDDVKIISVGNKYLSCRGNVIHNIGTTKALVVAPWVDNSIPDIIGLAGANCRGKIKAEDTAFMAVVFPRLPTDCQEAPSFRVEGTAEMWLAGYDTDVNDVYAVAGTTFRRFNPATGVPS